MKNERPGHHHSLFNQFDFKRGLSVKRDLTNIKTFNTLFLIEACSQETCLTVTPRGGPNSMKRGLGF